VNLDESGARLWHALGLGPLWRARALGSGAGGAAGPASPANASRGAAATLAPLGPASTGADCSADAAPQAPDPGGLDWEALEEAVAQCTACGLCRTRQQTVFAAGCQDARWMFIGEAPGAEEDARGEPFVGQAGRLLDNMLAESDLGREPAGSAVAPAAGGTAPRETVYIANVIKCRPPGNRNPEAAEVAACKPFLLRQIQLLQPRIIVVMGRIAAQALLATEASIANLRGRVHSLELGGQRYPVIVTYHPAYLLRTLSDKAKSWDDLCLARATYEALPAA
jgi:DNA polymerase